QSGKGRVGPSGGPLAVDRSRPWAGARLRAGRIPGTSSDGSAPAGADAERTGPAGRGRRPDRAERGDGKTHAQRPQHSAASSYPRRLLTAVARSSVATEARSPSN